jgi:GNAT superfamily N-acetyltransferase
MEIRVAEEKDRTALELFGSENEVKFASPIECTFIAEHNGKIIGYISYNPELKEDKWFGKHYETSALVVKEEYLGEGVVTKLKLSNTDFNVKARQEGLRLLSLLIEELTKFAKSKGLNLKLKH